MIGQNDAPVAYPESWWESRTGEQLQELLRAGFIGGELYDGAQRELERRARESSRVAEQAAEDRRRQRIDQGNRIALAAAIVSFLTAIGAVLWLLFIR